MPEQSTNARSPKATTVVGVRLSADDADAITALAAKAATTPSTLLRTWITACLASAQVTPRSIIDRMTADLALLRDVLPDTDTTATTRTGEDSLHVLVEAQMLTESMASTLRTAVRDRRSILIAGESNSGKTTLLRALMDEVNTADRLVLIEDEENGLVDHFAGPPTRFPYMIGLNRRDEQGLDAVLGSQIARLHVHRLVIDDLRSPAEIRAVITGAGTHFGGGPLATLHTSPSIAGVVTVLSRGLTSSASNLLSDPDARTLIGRGIDYLVVMERADDGPGMVGQLVDVGGDPTALAIAPTS